MSVVRTDSLSQVAIEFGMGGVLLLRHSVAPDFDSLVAQFEGSKLGMFALFIVCLRAIKLIATTIAELLLQ